MGFCTDDEYQDFLDQAPKFEEMLTNSGISLVKFWFSVSKGEQETRFMIRHIDRLRQWKLSPMDLASLDRWDAYTEAKETMFDRTDKPVPWTVVKSNDKKRGRLAAIRHVLLNFDYDDRNLTRISEQDTEIIGPSATAS
jgi:polyphosphate kinase 2 (PPK2 family)